MLSNEKIRSRNCKYELGKEISQNIGADFYFIVFQGITFRFLWYCLYIPINFTLKHLQSLQVTNAFHSSLGITSTCILSIYLNSVTCTRHMDKFAICLIQVLLCSLHRLWSQGFVYNKSNMCLLIKGKRSMTYIERLFSLNCIYPIDAVMCIPLLRIAVILLPLYSSFVFTLHVDTTTFIFMSIILKNSLNCTSGPVEQLVHIIGHSKPFSKSKSIVFNLLNIIYSCFILPWHIGFEPYFYELHHVYCHHIENCSPDDWQTPLSYDRLSLSNYIVFNFHMSIKVITGYSLIEYFYRKRYFSFVFKLLCSLLYRLMFMTLIFVFSKLSFYSYVFLMFPDGIGSEIAWAEHGLIDVNDLTNVFSSSATYLEKDNDVSQDPMNNWLHCEHHQRGWLHWSLLRESHRTNIEEGLYDAFNGNLFFWNGNSRHGIHKLFIYNNLKQLSSPIINLSDYIYSRTRPYHVIKVNNKTVLHPKRVSKIIRMIDSIILPIWKYIGAA